MNAENMLVVPIKVKVLLIGSQPPNKQYAKISYNYQSLADFPLGEFVEPDKMASTKETRKGAHVHWSLPKVMTHGLQSEEDGNVIYPDVPARWVVTRTWTSSIDTDTSLYSRSWIIESDVMQKSCSNENYNDFSPFFPKLEDSSKPYRVIGRSYPIGTSPAACAEMLDHLTAVAPGIPEFAAFYPECTNVFGFYDDMHDINGTAVHNADICYSVCGWYHDKQHDILDGFTDREKCEKELKLNIPQQLKFPAKTFCKGMVYGVKWINENTDYSKNIPESLPVPDIAVGNTSAEALAALAEWKHPENGIRERTSNLLFSSDGLLFNDANGVVLSENLIHQRRFAEFNSVNRYGIKEKQRNTQKETAAVSAENIEKIRELNISEKSLFEKKNSLEYKQEEIYDIWYKYAKLSEMLFPNAKVKKLLNTYRTQINSSSEEIRSMKNEIIRLENEVISGRQHAKETIDSEHIISEHNGQSYYEPNTPVILLSGVDCSQYENKDIDETAENFCRCGNNMIDMLMFEASTGLVNNNVLVYSEEVSEDNTLPEFARKMYSETVMLCPDFAKCIGQRIMTEIHETNAEKLKKITQAIKKLQSAFLNENITSAYNLVNLTEASGFNGIFPHKIGVNIWKYPWSPLFMRWSVNFFADKKVLGEKPVLDNWKFEKNYIDYKYRGEVVSTSDAVNVKGRSVITPHSSEIAAKSARDYLNNDEYAKAAGNLNTLSQTINGFNEKFIMQNLSLKIPVESVDLDITEIATELLKGYKHEEPVFNGFFSPVRAGFMTIAEIQIVDSFGQIQALKPTGAAVSEDMRNNETVFQSAILLPPRVIEPTRIRFDWLEAKPNSNGLYREFCDSDTKSSPICGWLIPNHMDNSVMVFSEDGDHIGNMQQLPGKTDVVWKDIPQNGGGTVPLPNTINEDMYEIILEIMEQSKKKDILSEFLNVIDSSLWNINPSAAQQYNDIGQYIGRPIIVTKAEIKLEQSGKPKKYKIMEKTTGTTPEGSPIDIRKAEFPVYIGRAGNQSDGVIGFYANNNYKGFHITKNTANIDDSYFINNNSVVLTPGDVNATKLIILQDFAASVDIISGILPVKTVKIPDDAINRGFQKLYFTLFTAPVITSRNDFTIPFPELDGKSWSYVLNDNGVISEITDLHHTNDRAFFSEQTLFAQEGWLKLTINQNK